MGLGLALSGGGSRAMAFHLGALAGLAQCGLLEDITEVSAVSGGSVLAGAWAVWLKENSQTPQGLSCFLQRVEGELALGLESRAFYHPRILKAVLPGISRTTLFAGTLDSILFSNATLKDLPSVPAFYFNVAVMNHGQIGRFSRNGFSSWGFCPPGAPYGKGPWHAIPDYPIACAVAASAAFPGLLPPIRLKRGPKLLPKGWGKAANIGPMDALALADGGVLENLGVELFLNRLNCTQAWDLVVSDAGPPKESWRPKGGRFRLIERLSTLVAALFNTGLGLVSATDLYRVALMMQGKSVRQMRHLLIEMIEKEILAHACLNPPASPAAMSLASTIADGVAPQKAARKLIFLRLDQDWDRLLKGIPEWRLQELADKAGLAPPSSCGDRIGPFLSAAGVSLAPARAIYDQMLGSKTPEDLGRIGTHFKALHPDEIHSLALHAHWQVTALKAIYW